MTIYVEKKIEEELKCCQLYLTKAENELHICKTDLAHLEEKRSKSVQELDVINFSNENMKSNLVT